MAWHGFSIIVLQVEWVEIPSLGMALDHREGYKVKSTVTVLIMAPEMNGEKLYMCWDKAGRTFERTSAMSTTLWC